MRQIFRQLVVTAMAVVLALPPGFIPVAEAASTPAQSGAPGSEESAVRLSAEQLEQLAAPVALYPDSLLAQVLMASTYPLEVVSAARWVEENSKLKGAELDAAVQQQSWDPSVKSLVKFPQVLQMMNEKLDWTEKLGNAFLAQPKDVMNSVQRLRARAQAQGTLKSTKQQTVKTQSGSGGQVIVIQPTQPDVVYVPSYNPTVVYGPWPYPAFPPYAWYPPGYVAAGAVLSFGFGVAVGSAMWGYPDWHTGSVYINNNYYSHFTGGPPPPPPPPPGPPPGPQPGPRPHPPGPAPQPGPGPHPGGLTPPHGGDGIRPAWQHNPQHRGNVPYSNPALSERFHREPGGISPSQARMNAREAFRGHGGNEFGKIGNPGDRERGMRNAMGDAGIRERGPNRGIQRPEAGPHSGIRERSPDRGIQRSNEGIFRGAGGIETRDESMRGSQSRQIMRQHPEGGGFHPEGGFRPGGGFHPGGGGFRGGGFHGGGFRR